MTIQWAARFGAVAVAVTTAVAMAGPVTARAATQASAGWRVVATAGSKQNPGYVEAIAAVAPGDAWAFGALTSPATPDTYQSFVRHWNGSSWRKATLPAGVTAALSGFPSTVAAGSSRTNIWAFTGTGAWVRFNGRSWTHGRLPLDQGDPGDVTTAVVLSAHDVWALGYYNPVSPLPYIAHYNGHRWTITHLFVNTAIVGASALGPKDIWVVGEDNTNVLLHFNGKSWRRQALPARASVAFFAGVTALSDKKVWITGDVQGLGNVVPGVMLWNGRSLSFRSLKAPAPLINTVPDGHGGIWAVAQEPGAVAGFRPEVWHYTGGRWLPLHIPHSDSADFIDQFAAVPGTRSTWAVGRFKSGALDLPAILLDGRVPR
jgi:hypothetical protein